MRSGEQGRVVLWFIDVIGVIVTIRDGVCGRRGQHRAVQYNVVATATATTTAVAAIGRCDAFAAGRAGVELQLVVVVEDTVIIRVR